MSIQPNSSIQGATRTEIIAFLSVAVAIFFLESAGAYLYFAGHSGIVIMLLSHLISVGVLVGSVWWSKREGSDLRLWVFQCIMVTVSGAAGALVALIAGVMFAFYARSSVAFAEWFATMFPEEEVCESGHLYERIVFGLDDMPDTQDVSPFRDVIAYGSFPQKQLVLVKITRYFRPEFAPILLMALRDEDNAVRVQAAGSIAEIESEYMEQYMELERQVEKHETDPDMLLKFAELCDEYAHSGILDSEREKQSREKSIEIYLKCMALDQDNLAIRRKLGKLYLQNREAHKACMEFEFCMRNNKGDHPTNLIFDYTEALFRKGDLAKLREVTNRYDIKVNEDDVFAKKAKSVLDMWQGGIDKSVLTLQEQS